MVRESDAPRLQDPAPTDWSTPRLRPHLAAEELFVGQWQCSGAVLPWSEEVAGHTEITLQQAGVHRVRWERAGRTVDAATLLLVPGGDAYLRSSPSPLPQRSTHLLFRGSLADPRRHQGPQVRAASPRLALLHHALLRATGPLERHERALAVWHEVNALLGGPAPALPERRSWRALADDVQHTLAVRFQERLTLDRLAAMHRVSPYHLARVFRAVTGASLHQHQTRLRLQAALHALRAGRPDLTRLALDLGFSSHSHFTNAFRAAYGVSPSRV